MDCDLARTLFTARIDGELPPVAGSGLRRHLLACAKCREEAGLHRRVAERTSGVAPPDPGPARWRAWYRATMDRIGRASNGLFLWLATAPLPVAVLSRLLPDEARPVP